MMTLTFESIARIPGMTRPNVEKVLPNKDYVPLTVESLLVFCQTRLRDLDTQIHSSLVDQQSRCALQKSVGELKSFLAGQASVGMMNEGTKETDAGKLEAAQKVVNEGNALFDEAIEQATKQKNFGLANALKDQKAEWNKGNDPHVTKDELQGINKGVDMMLNDLSSANELQMIGLQSLISKRATALQLTTNMLNTLNESQKTIAGNVGR